MTVCSGKRRGKTCAETEVRKTCACDSFTTSKLCLWTMHVTCPKVPRVEERCSKLNVMGYYVVSVVHVFKTKRSETELDTVKCHLQSSNKCVTLRLQYTRQVVRLGQVLVATLTNLRCTRDNLGSSFPDMAGNRCSRRSSTPMGKAC